jgi:hypothetical protein
MDGVDLDAVAAAAGRDKKRLGEGGVPFVRCEGPGRTSLGATASGGELRAALRELCAP